MSSKTNCLSLILLIFSVYLNPLPARTPQSPPSVFDLLTENEGNSLTIEVDLT